MHGNMKLFTKNLISCFQITVWQTQSDHTARRSIHQAQVEKQLHHRYRIY